jgi:hypothetical protein
MVVGQRVDWVSEWIYIISNEEFGLESLVLKLSSVEFCFAKKNPKKAHSIELDSTQTVVFTNRYIKHSRY